MTYEFFRRLFQNVTAEEAHFCKAALDKRIAELSEAPDETGPGYVILSFPTGTKINLIRTVRQLLGVGLREARDMVENRYTVYRVGDEGAARLRHYGADVREKT